MLILCVVLVVLVMRVTNLFDLGWNHLNVHINVTSSYMLDAVVPKVSLWDFSVLMESDTARMA